MSALIIFFQRAGQLVLTWSWQLAVLVAFVWVLLQLDRRGRPDLRHRLLLITMFLGLFLPWLSPVVGSLPWVGEAKQVWSESGSSIVSSLPTAQTQSEVPIAPARSSVNSKATTSATGTRWPFTNNTLFTVVGLLWCAGAVIAAGRKAAHHRRLSGILIRASAAPLSSVVTDPLAVPPVFLTTEVTGPMLYGWLRPVILLPQTIFEWTTNGERRAIVHHERTHFRRKDHWVSCVEGLTRTVFFFHPLMRWLCRQLDIERELACDAQVVRDGTDPQKYAEALLLVAKHSIGQSAGVHFAAAAQLSRRVESVLSPQRHGRVAHATVPFLLLVPVAALGLFVAPVQSATFVGTGWVLKFLPVVPEGPGAPIPTVSEPSRTTFASSSSQATVVPQAAAQTEALPRTAIMILRGQGIANEVRITLGIPYSRMAFSPRPFFNSSLYLEAKAEVTIDVTRISGEIVAHSSDPVLITVPSGQALVSGVMVFQKPFLIEPGLYRMVLTIAGSTGNGRDILDRRFEVPQFPRNGLAVSPLTLADLMEEGQLLGTFAIGTLKVRPNVTGKFHRDQDLNLFQQAYGESSGGLIVETLITSNGREFRRTSDDVIRSSQTNVTKKISLSDFPPGTYGVQTTITDQATGEKALSTAEFNVE